MRSFSFPSSIVPWSMVHTRARKWKKTKQTLNRFSFFKHSASCNRFTIPSINEFQWALFARGVILLQPLQWLGSTFDISCAFTVHIYIKWNFSTLSILYALCIISFWTPVRERVETKAKFNVWFLFYFFFLFILSLLISIALYFVYNSQTQSSNYIAPLICTHWTQLITLWINRKTLN